MHGPKWRNLMFRQRDAHLKQLEQWYGWILVDIKQTGDEAKEWQERKKDKYLNT